ncbi:MAG: PAS domain-containing sensor histidine kinase [Bacteroidales bacterium]|jgi:PAS domain S-box-containing protein|nr:PAS domain-containing sensor histidine kinase [Bacteroidales bacterium]
MKKRKTRSPFPWATVSVLTLMAAVLTVIFILYASGQKTQLITNAAKEMDAVARLKADQVAHWRLEKLNDARLIHENITLVEHIDALFIKEGNLKEKSRLIRLLTTLINNYDFGGAVLLDAGGRPGLAVPESEATIGENLRQRIPSIIAAPDITLSGFHTAESVEYLHLDLIIPMKMPHEGDTVMAGILVIRIDPGKELFPLISSWPTPGTSAECILFRFQADSVVYLNASSLAGFDPGLAVVPVSDLEKAALNPPEKGQAATTFTDYTGSEVVAAIRQVSGTDWYLAAKKDTSEILNRFTHEITVLWIIMVIIYFALASIGYLVVKTARVRYIRERYKEDLNRQAIMKHLDFVMKHGNDIILLIDSDMNIVEANERAVATYGYPRNKFIGMNVSELRTPEEAPLLARQVQDLINDGSIYIETVHERSDGTTFPIEISAHTVEVEGGRYFQSIGRDITDRKRSETEMRESNKKLNTIINNLRGVVFHCANDKDWTMQYISDGIYELAGYLPNEFIGNKIRSFESIIDPEDRQRVWDEVHQTLSTGYLYTIEYRIITSAGNKRWVWERGRGYYDSDKLVALEGFISDITDRKRIEEELIKARDKAERSDRLKTAFLHNISHEIRTPMNAIVGFTTLLDAPETNEEARKQYIDIIYQSSNQLLSIITDIVDISNIETGLVKVSTSQVNLNTLMRNLYDQYRIRTQQQGLTLSIVTHLRDADAIVKTDETKVIQIFSNLLNNALKFTRTGRIEFGYVVRGEVVEFFVSDTGIGIAQEHQSKVFERFFQVENTYSKQFSGTGLGLSISKAYVELLGGSIWLISKPGEGSLFCFSISLEKALEPDRKSHKVKA